MRHAIVASLTLLSGLMFVTPVPACINDRTIKVAEQEFKSQYMNQPVVPDESPSAGAILRQVISYTGGGVLLAGSVILAVRKPS